MGCMNIFEEIEWVRSEAVDEIAPMQECIDSGQILLDLIWVDNDKSVDPAHRKIRSMLCAKEHKTKKPGKIQFFAMPRLEAVKALVSITMSVGWSNKGKPVKLRHYVFQWCAFPRNSAKTHRETSSRRSSDTW